MGYLIYFYYPSLAAAIILAVAFAALSALAYFQFVRAVREPGIGKAGKKRNLFGIPLLIGGTFEVAGFIARAAGTQQTEDIPTYAISSVFTLIAPSVIAMSFYLCLERLILLLKMDDRLPFQAKKHITYILIGDRIAAVFQGLGGGLMSARAENIRHAGKIIAIVGLIAQMVFILFFYTFCFIFKLKLDNNPTPLATKAKTVSHRGRSLLYLFVSMLVAMIFVLVRCVYRTVQFFQGFPGYLIEHEVFLYVLDALMVFLAMSTFLSSDSFKIMNKISLLSTEPFGGEMNFDDISEEK